MHIGDDDLKNLCLIEIEMLLHENGRSLTDFKSMPRPNVAYMPTFTNKLIVDELNYNFNRKKKYHGSAYTILSLQPFFNPLSSASTTPIQPSTFLLQTKPKST